MAVDIHYLTGNKARKRQKRSTQLEEYFDNLCDDLTIADLLKLDRYIKSLDTSDSSSTGNSNSEAVGNSGNSRDYSNDVG
ncbi:hypothetical protein EJ02DRAFT_352197 [Clathrospora elynae]|uniref:Uncharacterized protein n=1 Tax=Clathrospora elynae TaxID=706981 RepID=A0A6A5SLU2_9PLEO|nr:hypothetical protein EJ02DRAFT_352197 [Clathrospora elynae]